MSATTRARLLRINESVLDQADFFQVDGFSRVAGLTFTNLSSRLFFDNLVQPWPLVNGAGVTDTLVASAAVYFHEITGAPGHYSVRFRPNAPGYWRLVLTYAAGQQIVARDYDIMLEPASKGGGLRASFV